MFKEIRADLHIHSCLSPCGEIEMFPSAIVKQAKIKGLDMIGITDHNASENVQAAKKVGIQEGVTVLGGIEITSSEEVHILGFFENDDNLKETQSVVYENLSGENDDEVFGYQLIVDENDNILEKNDKLLIGATTLSVSEIVNLIHDNDGLAIASHIDREAFSIIGQLGFIPPDLPLDALGLSPYYARNRSIDYKGFDIPLVYFSDAHFLSDIGKIHTTFYMKEATFDELKLTLQGYEGRKIMQRQVDQ
ncbi:PHP domain-containing protein [bacterium]|nr:PHP domain-containing protein [bacterium]